MPHSGKSKSRSKSPKSGKSPNSKSSHSHHQSHKSQKSNKSKSPNRKPRNNEYKKSKSKSKSPSDSRRRSSRVQYSNFKNYMQDTLAEMEGIMKSNKKDPNEFFSPKAAKLLLRETLSKSPEKKHKHNHHHHHHKKSKRKSSSSSSSSSSSNEEFSIRQPLKAVNYVTKLVRGANEIYETVSPFVAPFFNSPPPPPPTRENKIMKMRPNEIIDTVSPFMAPFFSPSPPPPKKGDKNTKNKKKEPEISSSSSTSSTSSENSSSVNVNVNSSSKKNEKISENDNNDKNPRKNDWLNYYDQQYQHQQHQQQFSQRKDNYGPNNRNVVQNNFVQNEVNLNHNDREDFKSFSIEQNQNDYPAYKQRDSEKLQQNINKVDNYDNLSNQKPNNNENSLKKDQNLKKDQEKRSTNSENSSIVSTERIKNYKNVRKGSASEDDFFSPYTSFSILHGRKSSNQTKIIREGEVKSKPKFGMVHSITSEFHLRLNLEHLGSTFAIIKFFASWCPTCQKMAPLFLELAQEYGSRGYDLVFFQMNVDNIDVEDVLDLYGVSIIPLFLLIRSDGKEVEGGRVGGREVGKEDVRKIIEKKRKSLKRNSN